jgi:hypothetical protein
MGASLSSSLHPDTDQHIGDWWDQSSSPHQVQQVFFDDSLVQVLLSNELIQVYAKPDERLGADASRNLFEGVAALDAGVIPAGMISVVEQMLLKLDTLSEQSSFNLLPQQQFQMVALNAIYRHLLRVSSDSRRKKNTPTLGECRTRWPREYVATPQVKLNLKAQKLFESQRMFLKVGLSLLCSLLEHTPSNAVHSAVLQNLLSSLEVISTPAAIGHHQEPMLFDDWSTTQRSFAEREVDLVAQQAEPFCSCTNSKTNSPRRAIQASLILQSTQHSMFCHINLHV